MKILLYPNPIRDKGLDYTLQVAQLLCAAGAELRIAPETVQGVALPETVSPLSPGESYDRVIALGGDGTMFSAARYAVSADVPLAGINLGRLGYLSALERGELARAPELLGQQVPIERRMLLEWQVLRQEEIIAEGIAVNDLLVKNLRPASVLQLSAESGGQRLYDFRGDGIIAATPTGSTAYTLSAGGPVMDPRAEALILTPICAHSIAVRSVVLCPERGARVRLEAVGLGEGILVPDGKQPLYLREGDELRCTRAQRQLQLVNLKETPFFDIMRKKLAGEA